MENVLVQTRLAITARDDSPIFFNQQLKIARGCKMAEELLVQFDPIYVHTSVFPAIVRTLCILPRVCITQQQSLVPFHERYLIAGPSDARSYLRPRSVESALCKDEDFWRHLA